MRKPFIIAFVSLAFTLPALAQTPSPSAAKSAAPPSAAVTPSADQILNHYVEALGGAAAWKKLNSRVSKGTIDVPALNLSGTLEIHEKAPDRLIEVAVIAGAAFQRGYDGTVGWADDPQNGLRDLTGPELAETRREADFYHPLDLKRIYSKFTVTGPEKVGDREVYDVEAALADGAPDKMYFDTQTGLVIRIISHRHMLDGVATIQEDIADYREVDGIKLPFSVHQSSTESDFTIKFTEFQHNVSLDDTQFEKPAAQ
jgi:hypothetical protein